MTKRLGGVAGTTIITAAVMGTGALAVPLALNSRIQPVRAASSAVTDVAFTGVPTDRSPEVYRGSFLYRNADAMLAAQGVAVAPEDKVFAFPDPALGLGSTIRVYRALDISIKDGKTVTLAKTWAKTVGEALAERSIELEGMDAVTPVAETVLRPENGAVSIVITRVSEVQVKSVKPVDFTVQYVDDADLEKGTERVQQAGSKGEVVLTYLVHREDGVETSRTLLSQVQTKDPQPKVVRRGTKVVTYGSGKASWYGGVPALTAAHKTLPKGTKVKVVNVSNGKSVIVTIADRGPYVDGRIIDLSQDAFALIAPLGSGVANVRLEKVY